MNSTAAGPKEYSILRTGGTTCIVLLLAIFAMALFSPNDSVFWIAARWGLIAVLVATIILSVWRARSPSGSTAEIAQGLAAIVTAVAFVVAARIYFLERRDKAGIVFDIVATRALLPNQVAAGGRARPARNRVLLGIRLIVTNRSSRHVEMKCIGLGLFRPRPGARLVRSPNTPEEMQLDPVAEYIAYERVRRLSGERLRDALQMRECLAASLWRVRQTDPSRAPASVRPLFMWGPLRLEPNDEDDRYFEIELGCEVPFVRVLAKMRIGPFDRDVYEAKAIIPLREICEGRAEGMATSVTADPLVAAAGAGAAAGPAPNAAAADAGGAAVPGSTPNLVPPDSQD